MKGEAAHLESSRREEKRRHDAPVVCCGSPLFLLCSLKVGPADGQAHMELDRWVVLTDSARSTRPQPPWTGQMFFFFQGERKREPKFRPSVRRHVRRKCFVFRRFFFFFFSLFCSVWSKGELVRENGEGKRSR